MAKRFHEVVCQTYPYGGMSQKCYGNTFLRTGVHMTSSFQVKIARFVWTEKVTEHFLQVTKEENIANILDREQT